MSATAVMSSAARTRAITAGPHGVQWLGDAALDGSGRVDDRVLEGGVALKADLVRAVVRDVRAHAKEQRAAEPWRDRAEAAQAGDGGGAGEGDGQ